MHWLRNVLHALREQPGASLGSLRRVFAREVNRVLGAHFFFCIPAGLSLWAARLYCSKAAHQPRLVLSSRALCDSNVTKPASAFTYAWLLPVGAMLISAPDELQTPPDAIFTTPPSFDGAGAHDTPEEGGASSATSSSTACRALKVEAAPRVAAQVQRDTASGASAPAARLCHNAVLTTAHRCLQILLPQGDHQLRFDAPHTERVAVIRWVVCKARKVPLGVVGVPGLARCDFPRDVDERGAVGRRRTS